MTHQISQIEDVIYRLANKGNQQKKQLQLVMHMSHSNTNTVAKADRVKTE